jgi:hypothetical protein
MFSMEALPNPAGEVLTVRIEGLSSNPDGTLALTDIAGRILRYATVTSKETVLNLSNLPSGVYMLRYADGERTNVIRVQKQ